jgi:hypothetical protein
VIKATGGASGVTAEEMKKLANEIQRTSNFSDDAALEAATLLSAFTEIRGEQFTGAIKALADLATYMGTDLPDAARMLGAAMDDPINNMTMLSRTRVISKEQLNAIESLAKQGDIVGAQIKILAALESRFGGLAQAAQSPLHQIWVRLLDIAETLGDQLLPLFEKWAKQGIGWLEEHRGAVERWGKKVAVVMEAVGDIVGEFWGAFSNNWRETLLGLGEFVADFFLGMGIIAGKMFARGWDVAKNYLVDKTSVIIARIIEEMRYRLEEGGQKVGSPEWQASKARHEYALRELDKERQGLGDLSVGSILKELKSGAGQDMAELNRVLALDLPKDLSEGLKESIAKARERLASGTGPEAPLSIAGTTGSPPPRRGTTYEQFREAYDAIEKAAGKGGGAALQPRFTGLTDFWKDMATRTMGGPETKSEGFLREIRDSSKQTSDLLRRQADKESTGMAVLM